MALWGLSPISPSAKSTNLNGSREARRLASSPQDSRRSEYNLSLEQSIRSNQPSRAFSSATVTICYITDRTSLDGGLLPQIARALEAGVDIVQIREKDLSSRELYELARDVMRLKNLAGTRVLINERVDVALAAGAAGVHLPSRAVPPSRILTVTPPDFLIGVSCHCTEEVRRAEAEGAGYVVFGPVFPSASKIKYGPPQGLAALAHASRAVDISVLALGGVTLDNAAHCMDSGAAGIAGISLFQQSANLSADVAALRALCPPKP